tara:strand:+ start:1312 stop:1941 length:630 start_codon:yes stop_codon:yes gene_type:complete
MKTIEIGKHIVSNEDVQNVDFNKLLKGSKAHILYTDPPWGDGNMKYWCTLNKRHTGQEIEAMSYKTLIKIIKDMIKNHVDGYVFLETGNQWLDETLEDIKDVIYNQKVYSLRYKSGSKLLTNPVIVGTTNPNLVLPNLDALEGAIDEDSLKIAIPLLAKEGAILLDPTCGMGNSARSAIQNKMRFVGNEFNSKRLEKTIKSLKRDENIQ